MVGDRLAEIRARVDAATPGPWMTDGGAVPWTKDQQSPFDDCGAGVGTADGAICVIAGGAQDEQGGAVGVLLDEDAYFIAASRTDVPYLLDTVAALQARVAAQSELGGRILETFEKLRAHDLTGPQAVSEIEAYARMIRDGTAMTAAVAPHAAPWTEG